MPRFTGQNKKKIDPRYFLEETKENPLNEEEIDPETPYGVVDSQTGKIIYKTTYKNANKARAYADKKDNEYGAYRYRAKILK